MCQEDTGCGDGVVGSTDATGRQSSVAREFLYEQTPLIVALLVAGVLAAYWQHGFLPGGSRAWPLAGQQVPIWHLIWMGLWTGYTMAIVGQAPGIFALPYSISILRFNNTHVTPTMQVLSVLSPLGALFGFRRTGQWNLDFALWPCVGAVAGGAIGPFLRLTVLAHAKPFNFTVGLVLVFVGLQLLGSAHRSYRQSTETARNNYAVNSDPVPGAPRPRERIRTLARTLGTLTIGYRDQQWTMNTGLLFLSGAAVGILGSALGIGGGFLLVPLFAAVYQLPMYVLVAATIPYTVALSAVGLVTFEFVLPVVMGRTVTPEWSWGLFAAAGGIAGSWFAAKTQTYVPEHLLKLMLGTVTVGVGAFYVISLFHFLLSYL